MKDLTSKLGWAKARPLGVLIPILIVFTALTVLLIGYPFNLSSSAAQAISGGCVWSIIVLIIVHRAGDKFLRLEDYADLQHMSTFMLLNAGASCVVVLTDGMQLRAWFGLMVLSTLPCLALTTITRRALFSQEEWTAVARKSR
ncbi:hypothetical protein [Methylobacterium sp. WL120]|uniref:hypothetical protein n=1 Tax=Methylobacterium sp. WL120 TaxID=2603887 RepID=UPI0011CC694F|nr:hypothetical protein [Methylobacterium sp. WL120]TXM69370.1 hypothetical protein FV229_05505 [Methylobacterium sp. WL120]